jgi:hypothetical protein
MTDLGIGTLTAGDLRRGAVQWRPDLAEFLGSHVASAFEDSIPGMVLRDSMLPARAAMTAEGEFRQGVRTDEQRQRVQAAHAEHPELRALSEAEWKASPWYRDGLAFDPWATAERAEARAGMFDLRQWRQHVATAREPGIGESVLAFGAELVGSFADPVNFVPLVGPAWRAAWVAKAATRSAYLMRAAAIGAFEGAAGTALVMPYTLTSNAYVGDDIGFADVMLDLAIGAALPAAVSGAGGWWSTRGGRSWALDLDPGGASVTPRPLTLDDLARESGGARPAPLDPVATARSLRDIQAAAADIATGRPIDTRGLREPAAPTLGDRLRAAPLDGPEWVLTADNQRFLAAPDGTPDIGRAPRVESDAPTAEELPVRLRRSDIRHLDDDRHRRIASGLGYADGVELVLDVVQGWTSLHEGHDGRLVLAKRNGNAAVAVVELAKADGGDFWRIVTGGGRAPERLGRELGTRAPTPGSASGQQSSLTSGVGAAGDAPNSAQSPRTGNGAAGAGPQPDAGTNRAEAPGSAPDAPDGAPETIDHPAAHGEDAAAEALATPEIDHIGRAVENARRPSRSPADDGTTRQGEAASGPTRADHELVSDVEAMLDPSDGDLLDVSAGYVSARSAERVRRMTGLDTYDLNLRVNKRTAREIRDRRGPGTEARERGEIPVEAEDYLHLNQVVDQPDRVTRSTDPNGKTILRYEKRMPDGTVYHAEFSHGGSMYLRDFHKRREGGGGDGPGRGGEGPDGRGGPDAGRGAEPDGRGGPDAHDRDGADTGRGGEPGGRPDGHATGRARARDDGGDPPPDGLAGDSAGDGTGDGMGDSLEGAATGGATSAAAETLDPDPDIAAFQVARDAGQVGAEEARAFARADAELERLARLEEAYDMATMCVLRGRG